MNTTISNPTNGGAFKHVKAQYIAAACGLALAASAIVAIAGNLKSSSARPISTTQAHSTIMTGLRVENSTKPQVAFYLVTSDEQAIKVREYEELAQWMRLDNGVPEPKRSIVVLRAGTPEEAASSRKFIDNAMAASNFSTPEDAPAFQVSDIMAGVVSTEHAAYVLDAAPRQVSDAVIMAGVISSERATYVFDAPVVTSQVSDSDLMAGVISTEHAAWIFPAD